MRNRAGGRGAWGGGPCPRLGDRRRPDARPIRGDRDPREGPGEEPGRADNPAGLHEREVGLLFLFWQPQVPFDVLGDGAAREIRAAVDVHAPVLVSLSRGEGREGEHRHAASNRAPRMNVSLACFIPAWTLPTSSIVFSLTDTQQMTRATVRDFVEREIIPTSARYDESEEFPEAWAKKMGELGLFGIFVPPEYGGSGLDSVCYAITIEELSRGDASAAVI